MPYLTPDSIPEGDDCRPLSIPASSEWLAFFGGALTELTKSYNWQKFGTMTVEETVTKMTEIINNWYTVPCAACTTPGGYRVIRINSQGHLEQLNEDGEWEPATDEYHIPPPEAREGGTSADQICLAAANAVNVLESLYENLTDSWNSELDEAEAITAFILALIALIGFEFAPITWAIVAFFTAVFTALYSALEFIGADLWDETVSAQIRCFLVECATNDAGVVTFDWECFNQKLNSLANTFSLTEEQLRLYAQIGFMLYFMGGGDALNLAGRTTAITEADCDDCSGGWCRLYDFTLDDYGFVPQAFGLTPLANWVDGVGFETIFINTGGGDPNGYTIVAIQAPFAASVQYIEMGFSFTAGTFDATGEANQLSGDNHVYSFWNVPITETPTSPASFCYKVLDPAVPVDVAFQLEAQMFAGTSADGSNPGGSATITYIKVMGIGTPPPDGEICDWEECFLE